VSRTPRQKKSQKKKGTSLRDKHDGAPLTVIANTTQHHGRQYGQQQDYSGHGGSKKTPLPLREIGVGVVILRNRGRSHSALQLVCSW
jgi:hypothetical protein